MKKKVPGETVVVLKMEIINKPNKFTKLSKKNISTFFSGSEQARRPQKFISAFVLEP